MPFNGSGSFQPLPAPDFPAVAGTTIVADYYNNVLQDVFDGLTNCLTRDGQSAPLTNLPLGNFKFTGAASASAVGQFLTWNQTDGVLATLTIGGTSTPKSALEVVGRITTSSVAEGLRLLSDGGFLSGYNAANTTRSGYLQFNAGAFTILANEAGTGVRLVHGGNTAGVDVAGADVKPLSNNTTNFGTSVLQWLSVYTRILAAESIPKTNVLAAGRFCALTANATLGDGSSFMGSGNSLWVVVYNDSGAAITIGAAGGVTLRLAGTSVTGTRTLAPRGLATVFYVTGTECVISGSGVT